MGLEDGSAWTFHFNRGWNFRNLWSTHSQKQNREKLGQLVKLAQTKKKARAHRSSLQKRISLMKQEVSITRYK